MTKWIKSSDKLPEIEEEVLGLFKFRTYGGRLSKDRMIVHLVYGKFFLNNPAFFSLDLGTSYKDVEYWIPLPKTPYDRKG